MSFREASRIERVSDDAYSANIPDGWQQGRGAFGGLVLGIIVRAARAHESDTTREVRTLAADIAGPVMVGPAQVRVRTLRRGQNQTNLQIDLEQEGNVLTSALCTLSARRKVEVAPMSPPVPAQALEPFEKVEAVPARSAPGPVFAQHYEYRNVGPLPFSGGSEALSVCYLRERNGSGELDAAAIVALLDAPWPSLFATAKGPHAMGTVSFSAQFLSNGEGLAADVPLFSPGRMHAQRDGYCLELRELWARDRLIAYGQQTVAVLR